MPLIFPSEQEDSALATLVQIVALLGAFGVLFWFINPSNVPMSESAWGIALIDMLLLALAIPAAFIYLHNKNGVVAVYSYGSLTRLAIACLVAYSIFTVFILLPYAFTHQSLNFYGNLQWYMNLGLYDLPQYFFVADVQPYVEEVLRFFFVPTTAALLFRIAPHLKLRLNKTVCVLISIFLIWSPFFTWYHLGVLQQNAEAYPGSMQEKSEMLFVNALSVYLHGCLFSVMNYVLGTCAFSIVYHKLHNTFGYFIEYGIPDLPLWFVCLELAFFVVTIALIFVGLAFVIKRRRLT